VIFKPNKLSLFGSSVKTSKQTALTLRIGPNEGVIIHLAVKRPGIDFVLDEVPMQFCYKNEFQMDLVEAYVKLLYDAIAGDPTLFPHADGIESSWACVEPLLQHLQSDEYEPEPYEKGSWGPASFEELLRKDGRIWMEPSAAVCSISNYSASKK
jgi:glucose-6-phosphate 1-dehydrogenase